MSEKRVKGLVAQRTAQLEKMKRIHNFVLTLRDDEVVEAVNIRLAEARETAVQIKI